MNFKLLKNFASLKLAISLLFIIAFFNICKLMLVPAVTASKMSFKLSSVLSFTEFQNASLLILSIISFENVSLVIIGIKIELFNVG